MKFLVDAQLPNALAQALCLAGHDAVHTSSLPKGNATSDQELIRKSMAEKRVVITKDADFAGSFIRKRQPFKLLVVSTGNLSNRCLQQIFRDHLDEIVSLLTHHHYLEIGQKYILVRD